MTTDALFDRKAILDGLYADVSWKSLETVPFQRCLPFEFNKIVIWPQQNRDTLAMKII